jgi:calcineurin-like phosphoesterase
MIVLFFGDVVGKPGRDLLTSRLAGLRARYAADGQVAKMVYNLMVRMSG